jgi:hypothetical protein
MNGKMALQRSPVSKNLLASAALPRRLLHSGSNLLREGLMIGHGLCRLIFGIFLFSQRVKPDEQAGTRKDKKEHLPSMEKGTCGKKKKKSGKEIHRALRVQF